MENKKHENKVLIGILRENRPFWERRVVLTPDHIKQFLQNTKQIGFIVQPSKLRIFNDKEYKEVGVTISEDLSECSLILGVREVPVNFLLPNKTYMFFSHTIKAQRQNMKMLDDILEKKIRLIDYEKITNEEGKRLVYFGKFAGNAGTIDFLSGLGILFLKMGISTHFINIGMSYKYFNIEDAKESIKTLAKKIEYNGIPEEFSPLVFAILGNGRTSEGVQEILSLLPIKIVDPNELADLFKNPKDKIHSKFIYLSKFSQEHMVELQDSNKNEIFSKKHYSNFPSKYSPIFHKKYLPYISIIFNCIYWDKRYPRLITNTQMKELIKEKKSNLLGVCDISCDLEGSIEFCKKYTTTEDTFYTYFPETGKIENKITTGGILYMSIDHLATQLAYDASSHISLHLMKYLEDIAKTDLSTEGGNLCEEIKRAIITYNGNYGSKFKYLETLRKAISSKKITESNKDSDLKVCIFNLEGVLFDNLTILDIIKVVQDHDTEYDLYPLEIAKNNNHSKISLQITCEKNKYSDIFNNINKICLDKDIKIEVD